MGCPVIVRRAPESVGLSVDGPWLVELVPGQKLGDSGGGVLAMRRSDVDFLLGVIFLGATGCWCPLPKVKREKD